MTLREFGQSIADYWNAYITEITTQHVLDWSIGNLLITAFGGTILAGALAILWVWLSVTWEKSGLPYTWVRLDKRYGPFYAGLIMVAGTIAFFIALGLLFALIEVSRQ
jgi:hypothetical protein